MEAKSMDEYLAPHFINRSNWLRAAVLGANDGILSTASIAVGIAAASDIREPVVLASLAGLVAGALSMAAGEYVSVSSQTDIEQSDIAREKEELDDMPELELARLQEIYEKRGLSSATAAQVARELTAHDALGAHVRDELGINDMSQAKPLQAALVSCASFTVGGLLPLCVSLFAPIRNMIWFQYGLSILFLVILGAVAAKAGGSTMLKAVLRVTIWGTIAMAATAGIGYLFGT